MDAHRHILSMPDLNLFDRTDGRAEDSRSDFYTRTPLNLSGPSRGSTRPGLSFSNPLTPVYLRDDQSR